MLLQVLNRAALLTHLLPHRVNQLGIALRLLLDLPGKFVVWIYGYVFLLKNLSQHTSFGALGDDVAILNLNIEFSQLFCHGITDVSLHFFSGRLEHDVEFVEC